MEITGYNSKTGGFDSYNFNRDGSFSIDTLTIEDSAWIWSGSGVKTTGIMSSDNKVLTVKHERIINGKSYGVFMDGTLKKGSDQ